MKVIKLHHHENDEDAYGARYAGTLGDAKKEAAEIPKHLRADVVAEEYDLQTDKEGIVSMLNGAPLLGKALRTWGVTARGALKEE